MSQSAHIELLNDLLVVQYRSLARYVQQISPWAARDDQRAARALSNIAHDQEQMAGKIAGLIVARGGVPDDGEFPIEFADLNLLSVDFFIHELIRLQKYDIASIEHIVAELGIDREARALAEEALGSERGHLEALEELQTSRVA